MPGGEVLHVIQYRKLAVDHDIDIPNQVVQKHVSLIPLYALPALLLVFVRHLLFQRGFIVV